MTYSLEKRRAAVELHIKYDFSSADVIREFGCPHRHTMRNWYLEFEENGILLKASAFLWTGSCEGGLGSGSPHPIWRSTAHERRGRHRPRGRGLESAAPSAPSIRASFRARRWGMPASGRPWGPYRCHGTTPSPNRSWVLSGPSACMPGRTAAASRRRLAYSTISSASTTGCGFIRRRDGSVLRNSRLCKKKDARRRHSNLSTKTGQIQIHRGGNRNANKTLHIIAMHRMRTDPRTIEYVERRRSEGLSDREIRRCIKRYIAREAYHLIMHPDDVSVEGEGLEMRTERIAAGVSQKDAAIVPGVTASTLYDLELGHHQFRELALCYRQWIDDDFPLDA